MTHDSTGDRLRWAYEQAGGSRAVFSPKVADYVASRPDYPAALFETLRSEAGLTAQSTIADVGAGTGLLTAGLVDLGCTVHAVEPNAAMRAAADHLLGHRPTYHSVDGSAETLPLPDRSVDLITAAQAFHWFEIERTRAEFLRVLKPSGLVALVWNDRVLDDPLHVALDEVFADHGGEQRGALLAHENRADVPRFFGAGAARSFIWPNVHHLDETGLVSLVFSRSYMPQANTEAGAEIARRTREIFVRFAREGRIDVRYTTVLILGRPS